jgi:ribosomal protein L39E
MTRHYPKKIKLGKANRRTKWAPVWALIKKFGQGSAKYHHVSEITKQRRNWRRTKLKIKPRKMKKKHLG